MELNTPGMMTGWTALALLGVGYAIGLAFAVRSRNDWSATRKLGTYGTGIVLVAGWALSFDALVAFAVAAGIDKHLAPLYAILLDGEMGVGVVTWVSMPLAAHGARRYIAGVFLASAAVSMVANGAHPYTADHMLGAPWSYGASMVPGLWIFLTVHQLVLLFRETSNAPALVQPRAEKRGPGGMKRALYAIPFLGKHVSRDWTLAASEAHASLDEPSEPQDALPEHAPTALPAPRERPATRRGATSKRAHARRLLATRSWDASTRAEVIKEVARKTGADVTSVRRVAGEIEKARAS